MAKIIGIYTTFEDALEATSQLRECGIDPEQLTIIGQNSSTLSRLTKSLIVGGATGAVFSFFLPGGGHLILVGHVVRSIALHALAVTAKGLAGGAIAGGTFDLLRRNGLDRRAAKEASEAVSRGEYALSLEGDWITIQRAQAALGKSLHKADPRLIDMVLRYGYEHQSFLSLYGAMKVWYSSTPEGAVVYRRVGRVALVVAAPLTAREHLADITRQFIDYCIKEHLDCLMMPIGEDFATIATGCGMALLGIGESGYFKLPEWRPAGDRAKKVRTGVNQALKAGIRVVPYDPNAAGDLQTRTEVESLCQEWINTRQVDALGWLLELDPFYLSRYKRYFLARNAEGRLEGLLACAPIPARNGWYLEDLIRSPQADRGVSELLVVEALKHLAADGASIATLATSPLAGINPDTLAGPFKQIGRLLLLVYKHLDTFYHFKTLHRFKSKFAPSFVETDYLAVYPPRIRLRMVYAIIGAFDPAGLTGLLASKLRRIWQQSRRRSTDSLTKRPE